MLYRHTIYAIPIFYLQLFFYLEYNTSMETLTATIEAYRFDDSLVFTNEDYNKLRTFTNTKADDNKRGHAAEFIVLDKFKRMFRNIKYVGGAAGKMDLYDSYMKLRIEVKDIKTTNVLSPEGKFAIDMTQWNDNLSLYINFGQDDMPSIVRVLKRAYMINAKYFRWMDMYNIYMELYAILMARNDKASIIVEQHDMKILDAMVEERVNQRLKLDEKYIELQTQINSLIAAYTQLSNEYETLRSKPHQAESSTETTIQQPDVTTKRNSLERFVHSPVICKTLCLYGIEDGIFKAKYHRFCTQNNLTELTNNEYVSMMSVLQISSEGFRQRYLTETGDVLQFNNRTLSFKSSVVKAMPVKYTHDDGIDVSAYFQLPTLKALYTQYREHETALRALDFESIEIVRDIKILTGTNNSAGRKTDNNKYITGNGEDKEINTIRFFKSVASKCNGKLPERKNAIVEYPVTIDGEETTVTTNAVSWLESMRTNNEVLFKYINAVCFNNERFDPYANSVKIITDAIETAVHSKTSFTATRIRLGRTGDVTLYSALNRLLSNYESGIESAEWARVLHGDPVKMKQIEDCILKHEKTIITLDLDIDITNRNRHDSCITRIRKISTYV